MNASESENYFKATCRCGINVEVPNELYDQSLQCPSCNQSFLARPNEKIEQPPRAATKPPSPNLRPCPDCGEAMSKNALACPKCGAVNKDKMTLGTQVLRIVIGIALFLFALWFLKVLAEIIYN